MRLARIICLLCVGATLAACSAIKLGYNALPELAYWWLDGYVDFTDAQGPRTREDIARLQQWHRSNELPQYGALLREAELLAPVQVSADQVCALFDAIRVRVQVLADRAEPAVVTLVLGLAPAQLAYLERKYAKRDAQFRKDWLDLTAGEQKEKRLEQMLERAEMVYGPLDVLQRATLRRHLDQSAFDAGTILAERQRRQADALATVRKIAGQPLSLEQARALIHGLLERALESPDAAYRAWQEALIQESCRTFAATHNSTTPAQRDIAVRRLRAYQRDLLDLSTPR